MLFIGYVRNKVKCTKLNDCHDDNWRYHDKRNGIQFSTHCWKFNFWERELLVLTAQENRSYSDLNNKKVECISGTKLNLGQCRTLSAFIYLLFVRFLLSNLIQCVPKHCTNSQVCVTPPLPATVTCQYMEEGMEWRSGASQKYSANSLIRNEFVATIGRLCRRLYPIQCVVKYFLLLFCCY